MKTRDAFFLSPLFWGESKPQHRFSLLKIDRPNVAADAVAPRAVLLPVHRMLHWLPALSPFLPVLTHVCLHLGQCGFLTLALLLPEEGQNHSLFCFVTVELWSLWSGLRGSTCRSHHCIKAVVLFALLNPGVLSTSVWSLLLAPAVIHANSKAQSQDREHFGNSIILRRSFISLAPFTVMCSSVAYAWQNSIWGVFVLWSQCMLFTLRNLRVFGFV